MGTTKPNVRDAEIKEVQRFPRGRQENADRYREIGGVGDRRQPEGALQVGDGLEAGGRDAGRIREVRRRTKDFHRAKRHDQGQSEE